MKARGEEWVKILGRNAQERGKGRGGGEIGGAGKTVNYFRADCKSVDAGGDVSGEKSGEEEEGELEE